MNNDRTSLVGVKISAGLLIGLGCLFAFYALFFGLLLGVSITRREGHNSIFGLLFALLVVALLTYLCFRAAISLYDSRLWAANVAIGFGALLLLFCAIFFYDLFHPKRQSNDEYFVILFVPFTVGVGLWWCVYLNLPRVRAYLKSAHKE